MKTLPTNYPRLVPAFAVSDGAKAIEFYQRPFGATELYRLTDPESGKIGHAELLLNDHLIMLPDEYRAHYKTPRTFGGTTMKLCLRVEDVDTAVARAVAAGATITMPS